MAAVGFTTHLGVGQDGNTAPNDVDPFRDMLDSLSGGLYQPDVLTQVASTVADVKAGTTPLGICSPTSILEDGTPPPDNLDADEAIFTHEFGMEPNEFLAWWYHGGGSALFHGILTALGAPEDTIDVYPMILRAGESGGWFKEAVTLERLLDGQYSDGTQIKYRAFGIHSAAFALAFPNVTRIGSLAGFTDLARIQSGDINAGEFNEPKGDASPSDPTKGLFPNWPTSADNSIIPAMGGKPHYYIGGYHTPFRVRALIVNKTWYAGLSAQHKDAFQAAVSHCMRYHLGESYEGADAIIQQWKDWGAVIHESLPYNVLDRFRTALENAQDNRAAVDANYATVINHQRAFMKANAVKWGSLPSRKYRVARTAYETDLKVLP